MSKHLSPSAPVRSNLPSGRIRSRASAEAMAHANNKVYLSGLTGDCDEAAVRECLVEAGVCAAAVENGEAAEATDSDAKATVLSVVVKRTSTDSSCYAFVELSSRTEAETAISKLNGKLASHRVNSYSNFLVFLGFSFRGSEIRAEFSESKRR